MDYVFAVEITFSRGEISRVCDRNQGGVGSIMVTMKLIENIN